MKLFILICIFLNFCFIEHANAIWVPQKNQELDIERIIKSMTLEEKVAQLLMVGFDGLDITEDIHRWITKKHIGGMVFFSRNIRNIKQIATFLRRINTLTDKHIPLFLALDQEGGNVLRIKNGSILLPGNMAIGATRQPKLAYVAGQLLAIDLKLIGFNMNLAPVLDINSNPHNPVIGVRSYGETSELVSSLGIWYIRGQQEMGIVTVAKHFPGHGNTEVDSHYSIPTIYTHHEHLKSFELLPFQKAINVGLDSIMTAHIALPNITKEKKLPATLSKILLTDILRKEMGFSGIVMTDGLEMQAIIERYGSGQASVMAILAGADMPMILWNPKLKEEVYSSILKAVHDNVITHKRLDQSVRRILIIKKKRGLFHQKPESIDNILNKNRMIMHDKIAKKIADSSITLVRNQNDILPINPSHYSKIMLLAPPGAFIERLQKEPFVKNTFILPSFPTRIERKNFLKKFSQKSKKTDLFIMAVLNRYHVTMARKIMLTYPYIPMVIVSFLSPYYLNNIPDVDAYVCTYSYLKFSQKAAAEAILGNKKMLGKLPVSISKEYVYGHSITTKKNKN